MKRRSSITFIAAALSATLASAALAQDTETNTALASAVAADGGLNRTALEMIARKNIFDPTRVGLSNDRPRPRSESFTFCGGAFDGPNAVPSSPAPAHPTSHYAPAIPSMATKSPK